MVHEFAFKLCGGDLETFVFDEFFDAIGDVEVVVGVLVADVAGFEVAEAVLFDEAVGCGLFVFPVALSNASVTGE